MPSRSRTSTGITAATAVLLVPLFVVACAGGPRPTFTFPPAPPATAAAPTPLPSPTDSAPATEAPSPSETAPPIPTPTPAPSPTPTPTPTPSATATPSPTPTAPPSPTPSPTIAPSPTPTGPPAATPLPGSSGFTPGTSANPRPIAITTTDANTFVPNLVFLEQGETVTFTVTNSGTNPHGFTIGLASDVFTEPATSGATASVAAGATASVRFTVTGVGPFAFASHEGGDLAAGQVGYAIVDGPDVADAGTDAAPRLLGVVAGASAFDPATLPARAGETVTFLVSNASDATREFLVGPADRVASVAIDQVTVVTTGPILPGQVKPVTYAFPPSGGSFQYAMHEPGAATNVINGTITFR